MSYQVLARKWRPRNFSTLVGQEHVVRALTHALNQQRLHHAYLFTGTRGVGKTTLARILAKSLNCESGVSASPCCHCSTCLEIDAGRFVDLLEVDAATNTRVDEMRQLLENAIYAPTRGRYKVYVIDEVHMLSTSAFNAMLKTLEEPPEHVKFILATTDPQKIPVTVLSRCLQFNLKQMPVPAMVEHMTRILTAEGIAFEAEALENVARAAAGSMRDALSLLDQAIAHGAGRVETAPVRDMLGTVDTTQLFLLLEALAERDGKALVALAETLQARSLSFANALQELAILLTRIQLIQLVPGAAHDVPEGERLAALAACLPPEFIQLAYQIVTQGRQELALAPDAYSGFLMSMLRLLAFMPEDAPASVADVSAGPRAPTPAPRQPAQSAQSAAPVPAAPATALASRDAPPVAGATPRDAGRVTPDDWHALVADLNLGGMARELAQHCDLVERTAGLCRLRLAPAHKHLLLKPAQEKLQQALCERLGETLRLVIELAEVARATPAEVAGEARRARQAQAVAAIEGDPFVQAAIDTFAATLVESSIQPIDPQE